MKIRVSIDRSKLCDYSRFSFTGGIMNHRQLSVSGIVDEQRDGAHSYLISSLSKAVKNLTHYVNETSNQGKKDFPASQPQNLAYPIGKVNQNHKIPSDDLHQSKQCFSIIQPRSPNYVWNRSEVKSNETGNNLDTSFKRLESGIVLLKNYVSLDNQVEIVNICQEFGVGPGGFYEPYGPSGVQRRLLMCFGRNWQPYTNFGKLVRSDGSVAPPLPDKLISLAETTLEDARACLESKDELPSMCPDTCLVNFYTTVGRLGLHQDCHESSYSLRRGLPIISFSIGDAAEFLYGPTRDVEEANKVLLESGDVLIFGGKSRLVFHGVKKIIPDSAPLPLLKRTMLRPDRLNLNFRQY